MLPDMSNVLRGWEQSIKIKTVTRSTTDFVETDVVVMREQVCVVQVAQKSKLNAVTIDWSLDYITVHSRDDVTLGEYIEFQSADYKVISSGNWNQYGYIEIIAEATGKNLIT